MHAVQMRGQTLGQGLDSTQGRGGQPAVKHLDLIVQENEIWYEAKGAMLQSHANLC